MKLKTGLTIYTGGKRYKEEIPDEIINKIKDSKPVKKAKDGDKHKKSDGKSS